ncbi:MAG TPA: hypothetical protein PK313_07120 [Myxococcota bacterium]|nr:hypothetical protein [Myxococcota bacterium]
MRASPGDASPGCPPDGASTPPARPSRTDAVGPAIVAAAFAVVALAMGRLQPVLDDHGLLTADAGAQLLHAGPAMLFFQFLKPTVMLVTLPLAALGPGLDAFLAAQALAGAIAVFLVGMAGARLHGRGWQSALVLAASPGFLLATLTGVSNAVAIVLLSLFAYLWIVRRAPLAAGLVLGALPWCRYEYAVFVVLAVVLAAATRPWRDGRWRLPLGAAVFPLLYLVAGALYHGDVAWFLRFPPEVPVAPGIRELDAIALSPSHVAFMAASLCLVSPLWAVAFLRRWRDLSAAERILATAMAGSFAGLVVLPFVRALDFAHNGRYWVMLAPVIALVAGGVRADAMRMPARTMTVAAIALAGAAVALALVAEPRPGDGLPPLLGALPLFLPLAVLAWARLPAFLARLARPLPIAALAILAGGVAWVAPTRFAAGNGYVVQDALAVAAWLGDGTRPDRPSLVITNIHTLRTAMARAADGPIPEVRFLVQPDLTHILCRLSNHDNGQYAALIETMRQRSRFGRFTWDCELEGLDLGGALFVVQPDYRLDALLGPDFWRDNADRVGRFRQVEAWRLRPGTRFPTHADDGFPLEPRCRIMCPTPPPAD